jgi:CubicO group peptidase (beta-lactamase class C family)
MRIDQSQSFANAQPNYSAVKLTVKENDPMTKKLVLSVLIVLATLTLAGGGSAGLPIQELSPDQDMVQDLSVFITTHMQAAKVPGLSIALIEGGQIRRVEGFGVANSLTGKPVAGDTVFEVASISKVISAYAALALVERGALDLDVPVQQYLSRPWLPASPYVDQITLRQLLSHTSGLTNVVNPVNKAIVSPPGERFEYSGVGYIYLQEVLEQVTGKPFEQIAQELVFEPLAMESSSFVNNAKIMPRLAYGHINYGIFIPLVGVVLGAAFLLALLVAVIVQRIRLGRFTLTAKMSGVCYLIAAAIALAFVIYYVGGDWNKWVTLTALWLVLFGAGMLLLVFLGRKLIARLPGKWQQPRRHAALVAVWSFICALALLWLSASLNSPIPRSPGGAAKAFASLRTTAPDLAKFLLELTSPQHLDPTLMAEMTSPQVKVADDESWGLGISIQQTPQGNLLWHDGNNADFHAWMGIDPATGNGVVVLSNSQYGVPLVREIANYALERMAAGER